MKRHAQLQLIAHRYHPYHTHSSLIDIMSTWQRGSANVKMPNDKIHINYTGQADNIILLDAQSLGSDRTVNPIRLVNSLHTLHIPNHKGQQRLKVT